MKKNKILCTILITITFFSLKAQTFNDALRFSENFYEGTARFSAMGGAFGALGADMSTLSVNPAGIAVRRHSEFTITPTLLIDNSEATFLSDNSTCSDDKYSLNLNNIGFVVAYELNNTDGWAGVNFGIAYNRLNNFNQNKIIEGYNYETSMIDYFVGHYIDDSGNEIFELDGTDPEELGAYVERLAFDTYLIDTATLYDEYGDAFLGYVFPLPTLSERQTDGYNMLQRKTIETKGGIGEYAFSFGANYAHKIYIGATFGIQSINYKEDVIYREIDENDYADFDNFKFEEHLDIHGIGLNFKLGLIAKPLQWLRIGAAIHTPTFYELEDTYSTSMTSEFDDPDSDGYTTYESEPTDEYGYSLGALNYEYELQTPFRAIGSLGFVIGTNALVSLDYEYADYSKMKFRASDYEYTDENNTIDYYLTSTHNFRGGVEYKMGTLSLRGGASYYASPYSSAWEGENAGRMQYSGGLGINSGSFYIDFAYTYTQRINTHLFYDVYDNQSLVGGDVTSNASRCICTLGFRFN